MPHAADHTGTVVAVRYYVTGVLGEGGFGRVYRARDDRLDVDVALKIIHPWWAHDPEWVRRFVDEAKTAASIGHPGVVRVTDTGTDPVVGPFQVSELVDGESLRSLLDREDRLAPMRAAGLVAQAAEALAAAHAKGVVHRDVKPSNLLVSDGRVLVCDFGIARLQTGLTRSSAAHTVIGTPAYMAPEQAAGKPAGPAADQYALGAVLFELLSGDPPFEGDTPVAVAVAQLTEPLPDPPTGTPAPLCAALRRALEKDPADRYPDLYAFAHALRAADVTENTVKLATDAPTRRIAHPRARTAPERTPTIGANADRRMPGWLRTTALVVVIAGVVAAAGLTVLPDGDPPPARQTTDPAALSPASPHDPPSAAAAAVAERSTTTVPDLAGLTEDGAASHARRHDLVLDATPRHSMRQPAGRVVSQRPAAGQRIQAGSTVDVTVSDGPPLTEIPDLVAADSDSARTRLAAAGLAVVGVRAVASGRPAGTVIRTEPQAGNPVPRGTAITLIVARAKSWRAVGAYTLTADGSTPTFTIVAKKWRITYTIDVCDTVCPRLDIDGDEYEQVGLAAGTHTTYGPSHPGRYRLTSDSVGSESYELRLVVEQYT